MKLKHAIICNYTGLRTDAVLCPPNEPTVINDADGSGRRVLHAIACALAIYRDPTRARPSKGWTKGQIDPPELIPRNRNADGQATPEQAAQNAALPNPATVLIETANGSRWKRWIDPVTGRTETLVETLAPGDERTAVIALELTPRVDEYFDGLDHQPGAEREHIHNGVETAPGPEPAPDEILDRIRKRIEQAFPTSGPENRRSAILLLDSTQLGWKQEQLNSFLNEVANESAETQVIAYLPTR